MGIDPEAVGAPNSSARETFDQILARSSEQASPQQRCLSVFESLETALFPTSPSSRRERRKLFEIAASFVGEADEQHVISPPMGAHWMLRLAAIALRFDPPIDRLPVLVTPDGAARWALERIPLTREAAIMESETRRGKYDNAGEGFYAPMGWKPARGHKPEFSALQDVERILSGLQLISGAVRDSEIGREVESWLSIGDNL